MAAAAISDFWNREILLWSIAWRRISMPNLVKIGQSVAKMLRFFDFSRWRLPPSWIFEIVNSYLLPVSGVPRRITVPNFVKIGCSIAQILRFFEFSRWPPPPSWIFEFAKFYWLRGSRGWRRISLPNFVIIGQSVAKILRFFNFSRWRPSAILDWFGLYLDHPQWVLGGLYHCANFGYDRCSSFYNMNVSIFGTFGWKIPIYAPKLRFWAILSPKWATISIKAKKGTPLHESASFEPLSVKMWWAVWPVGALLKKGYK